MQFIASVTTTSGGAYEAQCPSLPGCRVRGQTQQEAMQKLHEAVCGYLAAMNNFVPEGVICNTVQA